MKGLYAKLSPQERFARVASRQQARDECRDQTVNSSGAARISRTDLGIALLHAIALPGICYTREEIAAWAGTTDAAIYQIELRALKKIRNHIFFRQKSARDLFAEFFERRQPATRRNYES